MAQPAAKRAKTVSSDDAATAVLGLLGTPPTNLAKQRSKAEKCTAPPVLHGLG